MVFLDADDRLDPAFLERCLEAMPEDWMHHFVYTHFRRFGESDAVHEAPAYDRTELARENYIAPTSLLPPRRGRTERIRREPDDRVRGLGPLPHTRRAGSRGSPGRRAALPLPDPRRDVVAAQKNAGAPRGAPDAPSRQAPEPLQPVGRCGAVWAHPVHCFGRHRGEVSVGPSFAATWPPRKRLDAAKVTGER